MIASYFGIDIHRILLVIIFSIFFIWLIKSNYGLRLYKYLIPFLIFFIFLIIIDIILGRGLRTFSYCHTFIYIIIFFNIFFLQQNKISAKMLFNQSNTIFKVIIIFMLIESIILITGNFNFLQNIFSETGTSVVQGFRSYHNRFAQYYNLDFPGLNSLITGNQIASTLAVLSIIWFAPVYKFAPKKRSRNIWFIFSVILLIFSPTMTAVVLLLIAMIFLFFIIPISNKKIIKMIIPTLFTFFLVGNWSFKFIFLPLYTLSFETSGLLFYLAAFIFPIKNYLSLPLMNILFGAQSLEFAHRYFFNEIGIIRLAMIIGLPLIIIIAVLISITFLKFISLYGNKKLQLLKNSPLLFDYRLYSFLALVNILIVFLWIISTFHYLIIFRLGVVQLIAFQFSICIFSIYKMEAILNNIHKSDPIYFTIR